MDSSKPNGNIQEEIINKDMESVFEDSLVGPDTIDDITELDETSKPSKTMEKFSVSVLNAAKQIDLQEPHHTSATEKVEIVSSFIVRLAIECPKENPI